MICQYPHTMPEKYGMVDCKFKICKNPS